LLTEEEHSKLIEKFWQKHTDELIDKLNNYIWSTWKRYKSHYYTILNRSKNETTTHTNLEKERQIEQHRQRIAEQIESFNSQPKQNAETWNQTGWYNRRENISFSELPW
jgi:DNA-binding transcriptional regulator of glucitol operon